MGDVGHGYAFQGWSVVCAGMEKAPLAMSRAGEGVMRQQFDQAGRQLALVLGMSPFHRRPRLPPLRAGVRSVSVGVAVIDVADAPLRRRVTTATNKVEAFNGFSQSCRGGAWERGSGS
jgi:outer membrane protein TolC